MFLFNKEIKENFIRNRKTEITSFPEFIPWKYGPFSKDVYADIEFFINNGSIDNSPLDSEMTESEINEFGDWVEDFLFIDEKEL